MRAARRPARRSLRIPIGDCLPPGEPATEFETFFHGRNLASIEARGLFSEALMILILFRSRLTEAAGEDYVATDARMEALAREAPGFVDVKAYTAADGERLTIVRWKDLESLRQWREDPRHRAAQEMGREPLVRVLHLGGRRARAREPLRRSTDEKAVVRAAEKP